MTTEHPLAVKQAKKSWLPSQVRTRVKAIGMALLQSIASLPLLFMRTHSYGPVKRFPFCWLEQRELKEGAGMARKLAWSGEVGGGGTLVAEICSPAWGWGLHYHHPKPSDAFPEIICCLPDWVSNVSAFLPDSFSSELTASLLHHVIPVETVSSLHITSFCCPNSSNPGRQLQGHGCLFLSPA